MGRDIVLRLQVAFITGWQGLILVQEIQIKA